MRGPLAAVVCAAAAACVPIDPYRGPNENEPIVALSLSGDPASSAVGVRGGAFFVEFSAPSLTGARYPSRIELGGVEVLGRGIACNGEDRVGMTLDPAFNVSARYPADVGTVETLDMVRVGPANIELRVTWQYAYACSGTTTTAYGASRFSFFPDGRVVRNDIIQPTDAGDLATGGATGCGCAGPPEFYYMTSYIALRDPAFRRLLFARIPDPRASEEHGLPIDPGDELFWISYPNPIWACLGTDGDAAAPYVGIAWTPTTTDNNGTRIRSDLGEEMNTVLIWDWLYSTTGAAAVPMTSFEADTALFLGVGAAEACSRDAIAPRAAAFTSPPELTVQDNLGGNVAVGLTRADGMYHWNPGLGAPRPTSLDVRPAADIAGGLALHLRWPVDVPPIVRRNGAVLRDGYAYLAHAPLPTIEGDYELLVWLRSGLSASDTLTISVP